MDSLSPVDIETSYPGLAGCRDRQAAEHTHGGGLPCPVCPEEAEYLARLHLETDMIDGGEGAETFGQLFYFYRFHFLSLFHNYNAAFPQDSTSRPTRAPHFPSLTRP